MVITMAKLRMAHASTHGARKPPGPKLGGLSEFLIYGGARNVVFVNMDEELIQSQILSRELLL